jgi:exopolysaccharide production protein ExoZ
MAELRADEVGIKTYLPSGTALAGRNAGESDGRMASLQAIRAAAALLVLIHHTSSHIFTGTTVLNIGYAGVDLFFVLSGFVIYFAHHRDIGRPDRLGRYARRRFTRIYPTYIIVTLISLPAVLYIFPDTRSWQVLLASVLIADAPTHVLNVAWTLVHEVHFYIAFGLCILFPRWTALIFVGVLAAVTVWSPNNPGLSWAFPVARLDFQFLMGIFAAMMHLWRRWPLAARYACFIIGCVVFTASAANSLFGWWPAAIPPDREDTGLAAMLIIFGAAGLPCPWALLQRLGDASYLIYLIHYQTLALFVGIAWKLGFRGSALPPLLIALGIVFVSVQLYERAEAPMLDWLRSKRLFLSYRRPAARA